VKTSGKKNKYKSERDGLTVPNVTYKDVLLEVGIVIKNNIKLFRNHLKTYGNNI